MTCFLSPPDAVYRQTYLEALREFHAELHNLEQDSVALTQNFEGYVRHLLRQASDERRDGLVPESFYWLIDDGMYIGRLSLRHHLNDRLMQFGGHIGYEIRPGKRRMGYGKTILRLGLEQAQLIGITRALVTCDDDNIASAKIIEANGGILENTVLLSNRVVPTRRYWIDLPEQSE